MKGRVAQAQLEAFAGLQQALEDMLWRALLAQFDGAGQLRVGLDYGARRGQCLGGDIGAGEVPAVFAVADQRVDAVGADANIQGADGAATRDLPGIFRGQQVGEVVQVVGATRDRRAQIAVGNVPVLDAVELLGRG